MDGTDEVVKGGRTVAHNTLRQAIQTWQQRLQLTGVGLVETTLGPSLASDGMTGSTPPLCASIDATLAQLARLTPGQLTVELAYPWCREASGAGALLGLVPDTCCEQADAA